MNTVLINFDIATNVALHVFFVPPPPNVSNYLQKPVMATSTCHGTSCAAQCTSSENMIMFARITNTKLW